jgi:hypothetical protein
MIGAQPPQPRSDWVNAMPFVPAEDTALVEIRMDYAGQKVENTIWVHLLEGSWDGPSLAGLAGVVKIWWAAEYGPLVSNAVTLTEVVATDMTTEVGAQSTLSGGGAIGGEGSGAQVSSTTLAVSFRTALRGRSYRGRNYIVGIPASAIENINFATDAFVADITAAYEALLTALSAEDFTWVIASRFSGTDEDGKPIPRTTASLTPVTNIVCADNALDNQRRRLPGRGQ